MRKAAAAAILVSSFSGAGSAHAVEDAQAPTLAISQSQHAPLWTIAERSPIDKQETSIVYVSEKNMDKLNTQMEALGKSVHDQLNRNIEKRLQF